MPITGLTLITLTGKYLKFDGTPAAGSVTFTPTTVIVNKAANEIVMPVSFTVTLNIAGAFSVDLPATNDPDLEPVDFTYTVTEAIVGIANPRTYSISLPHDAVGSTLDLADLAPVESSTGTGATGGVRIEDEGVTLVSVARGINFAGAGVTVTDAGSDEALVTIPGGTTGAIPASLLDAKGDLIAASAADTAARLAVGTNGQVLSAQSSTSTGLSWADSAPLSNATPLAAGTANAGTGTSASRDDHVHPLSAAADKPAYSVLLPGADMAAGSRTGIGFNDGTIGLFDNGRLYLLPAVFSRAVAIKVALNVTAAGSAGSVIRFGIWNDHATAGNQRPGTLAADLGTADSTSTGVKVSATTFTPIVGTRYWVGVAGQGAPTLTPTVTASKSPALSLPAWPAGGGLPGIEYRYDGITGTFGTLASTNPTATSNDPHWFLFETA